MEMESREASTPVAKPARYRKVNTVWPETLPALTPQEAVSAAKRLYRLGTGNAFKGQFRITSGHRYTWIRRGVFVVNPGRGWHHLVHDISHIVHQQRHPGLPPHHPSHMETERLLAEMAVTKWLDGSLRREPKPKPDLKTLRHQRVLARIKTWEGKLKRAENALKKLNKTRAYYEKGT